jgi:hypothetical protein
MIEFSSNILALLANPVVETVNLVRIGDYYTTDFYRNIQLSDNSEYIADGRLISVQTPRLSSVVDSSEYSVVLADPDLSFGALAETLVGKVFEARICFINTTTNAPLTNINDTILSYAGKVGNTLYSKNTNPYGEILFEVRGNSPMANFEMVRTFHTTRDFLSKLNPSDKAFEQVYDGSGAVRMRWGRK